MLYLRVHQEVIQERMRKLGKIAMRLELKDAVNNCSLINDSYNSDLGSLTIALDFLNQQQGFALHPYAGDKPREGFTPSRTHPWSI